VRPADPLLLSATRAAREAIAALRTATGDPLIFVQARWTSCRKWAAGGGTADGPASHDIGFVLEHSEHVWYRCPAAYQWCTSVSWIDQRISHWGYRASAYEVTTPRMVSLGMSDWLVTERRLATRQSDGQVISIYWTALAGLIVDLVAERVVLEGVDGYHGELAEPGIAPMAVAAIAACHGPHALLDHPALASLRSSEEGVDGTETLPSDGMALAVSARGRNAGQWR
jgi:hypothetical protein